jgi:hypothetical protein
MKEALLKKPNNKSAIIISIGLGCARLEQLPSMLVAKREFFHRSLGKI